MEANLEEKSVVVESRGRRDEAAREAIIVLAMVDINGLCLTSRARSSALRCMSVSSRIV